MGLSSHLERNAIRHSRNPYLNPVLQNNCPGFTKPLFRFIGFHFVIYRESIQFFINIFKMEPIFI